MDSILVRLILCGVLICSVLGCTAINRVTTAPQSEQKVVEEDVAEDVRRGRQDESSQAPGITDQPPAPAVEQPWQDATPAEPRPRRYHWSDRKGWSPGNPEMDTTRP